MINPSQHIIQISTSQGKKDYLPVAYRIQMFRQACPEGTISTEILHLDFNQEVEHEVSIWNDEKKRYEKVIKRSKGIVVVKATVTDGKGGSAMGMKTENGATFNDNCWLEKAETGAIGRALAALGFGTLNCGDELDEGDRLADAPVERKPSYDPDKPCTPSQLTTITKLQKELGMAESDCSELSFGDCASMLQDLQKRLQQKRKAS